MTHAPVQHLSALELSEWVDDAIDALNAARHRDHLAQCAQCREAMDFTRRIRDDARLQSNDDPARPELWAGIVVSTVYHAAARRRMRRELRGVLFFWMFVTFCAGAATTEALRSWARAVASAAPSLTPDPLRGAAALRRIPRRPHVP